MWQPPGNVIENPALRNCATVFHDRSDAGRQLAGLLDRYQKNAALVVAVPAGGIPVALALARHLALAVDVLVVSKMTLPWNTEVGFGAIAADGTMRINQDFVDAFKLSPGTIKEGIDITRQKVARREKQFHELITSQSYKNKTVILVDDGLASGFTMCVAIESARKQGANNIVVAVPTGNNVSIERVACDCDQLYCANIRQGRRFAVADAYESWTDVNEDEVLGWLPQTHDR